MIVLLRVYKYTSASSVGLLEMFFFSQLPNFVLEIIATVSLVGFFHFGGVLPVVLGIIDFMILQELIKDQVANMYLWPKRLEVQIMDPAK